MEVLKTRSKVKDLCSSLSRLILLITGKCLKDVEEILSKLRKAEVETVKLITINHLKPKSINLMAGELSPLNEIHQYFIVTFIIDDPPPEWLDFVGVNNMLLTQGNITVSRPQLRLLRTDFEIVGKSLKVVE